MAEPVLFKLNDEPIDFNLNDDLTDFKLKDGAIGFNLLEENQGNYRLLEDNFIRLTENGDFRILEYA